MKTFKQFVEHHQTDANGKVIEHGDGTPSSVEEAKVEAGRSDYGKASVRNKRKFGKEGEPAIFDASGERGKMIDQRRAEHKAKRGVKEDYYSGTGEKVVARTKKWMDKKGQEGAPGLDAMKARTAEHKAKRGVKEDKKWIQKADIKKGAFTKKADAAGMTVQQFAKKVVGNKDKFSSKTEKQAHLAQTFAKMEEVQPIKEDDAYKYVVSKLKKKYGSGVLTKGDKIKPQSAADKAKARSHQAKVDAENAAERKKDPSQGRYPKGYSNRGSD